MRFEGSFQGVQPQDRLECGICRWVYDPAEGDDVRGIPASPAFAAPPPSRRAFLGLRG